MKREILTLALVSSAAIVSSGCCTPIKKTADILKEEQSRIVLTINKDHSMTLINVNTGERIMPCKTDIPPNTPLDKLREQIVECLPPRHSLSQDLLNFGQYIMWKGSDCFAGVEDSDLYAFCSPPLDLGF